MLNIGRRSVDDLMISMGNIEPFFDRLDQAFGIKVAWMKGMKGWRNNHPVGMLWLSTYPLCLLYNHRRRVPVEHVKQILDAL